MRAPPRSYPLWRLRSPVRSKTQNGIFKPRASAASSPLFSRWTANQAPRSMLLTGAKLAESIGWPSHFDALREKMRVVHATIAALLAGTRNRLMCHNAAAGVRGIVAETFPPRGAAIHPNPLTANTPHKPPATATPIGLSVLDSSPSSHFARLQRVLDIINNAFVV